MVSSGMRDAGYRYVNIDDLVTIPNFIPSLCSCEL